MVEKIYPNHAYTLRKAVISPPNILTMGDLWIKQDERADAEKDPDFNKKRQTEMSTFVLHTHVIFLRLYTG